MRKQRELDTSAFLQAVADYMAADGRGDSARRKNFLSKGAAVLKALAKLIGLSDELYVVESDHTAAGKAGEVVLNSSVVRVRFAGDRRDGFRWRTVSDWHDVVGVKTFDSPWEALSHLPTFALAVRGQIDLCRAEKTLNALTKLEACAREEALAAS